MPKTPVKSAFSMVFLIVAISLLSLRAYAAENVCSGCAAGSFNGLPACTKDGYLHLCEENIPDNNFRNYITAQYDSDGDCMLAESLVDSISEFDCQNRLIYSLKGIGFFTGITHLQCSFNRLSELDVSLLPNLQYLHCSYNLLTSLKLNNNELRYLDCCHNQLEELHLHHTAKIETLNVERNYLRWIDLSNCTELSNAVLGVQELNSTVFMYRHPEKELFTVDLTPVIGNERIQHIADVTALSHPLPQTAYDPATGTVSLTRTTSRLEYIYLPPTVSQKLQNTPSLRVVIPLSLYCDHNWAAATCTRASFCTVCGEITNEFAPHNMLPATETRPAWCSKCGYTEGHPLDHVWVPATCTTAKYCKYCKKYDGFALGHNYTEPNTCLGSVSCTRCSKSYTVPLNHQWETVSCDLQRCVLCGAQEEIKQQHAWSKPNLFIPYHCIYCNVPRAKPYKYHQFLSTFAVVYALELTASVWYLLDYKRERKY